MSDPTLRVKTTVAVLVAADLVRDEDPGTANHAARLAWAKRACRNPAEEAEYVLRSIVAQNRALTVAQIQGVTDANLQTAVNTAVNLFAQ